MIQVLINSIDLSEQIPWESLEVNQALTSEVDTAVFEIRKYGSRSYVPEINDEVEVYDGVKKIFGGYIMNIEERVLNNADGLVYSIQCADYSVKLSSILATREYESETIADIIADLISTYAPEFTTTNVASNFVIEKIIFNEVYLSECIKKLAEIVKYDWRVDEDMDIHFFPKTANPAPFGLTDTSGNYIVETLKRNIDGTQIVNQVKVRGGEGDGEAYTGIITVKGNDSKIFGLPYKFSNLTIEVDTGGGYVSKTVGQDFKDSFSDYNCLQNFQEKTIKFNAALADGNKIRFSGNPKVPIKTIVQNVGSIAQYGLKEKIINDPKIIDSTTARKRAKAELLAYQNGSNEISFETYDSGLEAGMIITLDSDRRGVVDNYVISSVRFAANGPDEFIYEVRAITTNKLKLIELLQKLSTPEQDDLNESAVSETIYTDLNDIDIIEIITKVAPLLDQQDIGAAESINKDPLGPGVEPTWVLGPYAPSSVSDTKRQGRFDYSLKFY